MRWALWLLRLEKRMWVDEAAINDTIEDKGKFKKADQRPILVGYYVM